MSSSSTSTDKLHQIMEAATRAGADAVEVIMATTSEIGASVRLGGVDEIEKNREQQVGIRAFVGKKSATVGISSLNDGDIKAAAEFVVASADLSPIENPDLGLAQPGEYASAWTPQDNSDPEIPTVEELIDMAKAGEGAALENQGLKTSEGASAYRKDMAIQLLTSEGFEGAYNRSKHGFVLSLVAEADGKKESEADGTSAVFFADLEDHEAMGRRVAEATIAKLGARQPKSGAMPVVYHPDASAGLIRTFAGALSGKAVKLEQTFLLNSRGKKVMPEGVTLTDDPTLIRGLMSKPFDAEGIQTSKMNLVEDGVLQKWLLDLESARALGLDPQGNASGGPGASPGPGLTNLYLSGGTIDPKALISDIQDGVLITSVMGRKGANTVNGGYSCAASGFMIENGEISFPISEFVISGKMEDMFMNMTPANDIDAEQIKRGRVAPTLRVEGMSVAGM